MNSLIFFFQFYSTEDYLCSECGMGFKHASALKSHSAIHLGKTIKCPDCPLEFLNTTKLKYHRETHMNIKYKCNLCTSIHGSRAMLTRHISKPYKLNLTFQFVH